MIMTGNQVEFTVYGRQALFTDVLTRIGGERCTYMIPTYEALKGILHSIYWKPTIIWYVDSVRVMNRITTVRKGIRTMDYNDSGKNSLSYYTYLEDVQYRVKAHFEWNLNRPEMEKDRITEKHLSIAKRSIESGGRRDIFLGTRECQGYVEPCRFDEGEGYYDAGKDGMPVEMPFSTMYHGITYPDEAILDEDKGQMTVRFWQPVMRNGVIDFCRPEECPSKRHIRKMPIKQFGSAQQSAPETDNVSDVLSKPWGDDK